MPMRRVNRIILCCGLLLALETACFPCHASLPMRGPPPCDQSLESVEAKILVRRLAKTERDYWKAECIIEEFGRRGKRAAPAVPELIKLMNNPASSGETIGHAIAALARIGDSAASAVPGMARFASSSDQWTAWMAIWGLENIGKSGTPAIPMLAKVALSDEAVPSGSGLAVQNYAAKIVGKLGQFDPATAGPYLVTLANRPGLLGGVCEGIQWMGVSVKPWASQLKLILDRGLLEVLRQEAEATPTGNPGEKGSSAFILAHNLEGEITGALAVLSDDAT
jgi:hypothetical protein